MKNFTPGEWYAKDGQIYPLETGKTLAVIPYYDETEEQKANAQLIAAAPDMLNVLQNLEHNFLVNINHNTPCTVTEMKAGLILIMRAIKKATL